MLVNEIDAFNVLNISMLVNEISAPRTKLACDQERKLASDCFITSLQHHVSVSPVPLGLLVGKTDCDDLWKSDSGHDCFGSPGSGVVTRAS